MKLCLDRIALTNWGTRCRHSRPYRGRAAAGTKPGEQIRTQFILDRAAGPGAGCDRPLEFSERGRVAVAAEWAIL